MTEGDSLGACLLLDLADLVLLGSSLLEQIRQKRISCIPELEAILRARLMEKSNKIFKVSYQAEHVWVPSVAVVLQPACNVVANSSCVVVHVEVGFRPSLDMPGLAEARVLAEVVAVELFAKGLVCCLGHNTLLFEDREYTHWLQ